MQTGLSYRHPIKIMFFSSFWEKHKKKPLPKTELMIFKPETFFFSSKNDFGHY